MARLGITTSVNDDLMDRTERGFDLASATPCREEGREGRESKEGEATAHVHSSGRVIRQAQACLRRRPLSFSSSVLSQLQTIIAPEELRTLGEMDDDSRGTKHSSFDGRVGL